MRTRTSLFHFCALGLLFLGTSFLPHDAEAQADMTLQKHPELWVNYSSDEWIDDLEKQAVRDINVGHWRALGSILAIFQLADDARAGHAQKSLENIQQKFVTTTVRQPSQFFLEQAYWLSRMLSLSHREKNAEVSSSTKKTKLVDAWRIVGPFRDVSGHGIERAEGPEIARIDAFNAKKVLPTQSLSLEEFRQQNTRWNEGAYEVVWRSIPKSFSTVQGVPLDVFIYPRKETCTYLSSVVYAEQDTSIQINVMSAGSLRVLWDGFTIDTDQELHSLGLVDRSEVTVDSTQGSHLLTLKVCSGSQVDSGRVRAILHGSNFKLIDDFSTLPSVSRRPKVSKSRSLFRQITELEQGAKTSKKQWSKGNSLELEQLVVAAMVRRLAGADDQRSPHLQGILDRIVASNPPVDLLALVGVLAPARANETAWLNMALTHTEHDASYEPVAQFARRSLVESRIDAGYLDWAATTVTNTELRTAPDLDAQILRARILDRMNQNEEAWLAYVAIFERYKNETPTSVLRAMTQSKFRRPQQTPMLFDQLLRTSARASASEFLASRSILGKEAVRASISTSLQLIQSAEDIEAIAEQLRNMGLFDEEVRFLVGAATQLAPNRKALWSRLTQALAQSKDLQHKELTKQAFVRARMLDPSSPFLRAEQNLIVEQRSLDDEQFMPKSSTFLARRKGAPAVDAAGIQPLDVIDRELHWLRVVTADDSGRVSQLIHYSREIVKAPKDSSDLNEPNVPAEGDLVEIVRAKVHRIDGSIAVPQEITEGQNVRIRWPQLKPGDVVEVATRSYTELPIGERGAPPFYFMDFAGGPATHPVFDNEVIVRSTAKHPLYTALINESISPPDEHTTTTDPNSGRRVERYAWHTPINLPEEPLQPKSSEIFPTIIGSQFRTWNDFIQWYQVGVESFSTIDLRIQRQAELITKGKKTREEKLNALFNWVADQIKYVNYISAEQWLPNRPQNVLDRMQGDCDDKAMLLMTMLKAIGINDAQEVLVQTRYTGMPSVLRAQGAVAPLFDHGIAFLPGKGNTPDRYLDATSPQSRIGPLPSMDGRALAIRITPTGPTPIVTLPVANPEEHGVTGTWSIAIQPDGSADITVDEMHRGDSAFELRTALKQAASATQWLEKHHSIAALPQLTFSPNVVFNGELPRGKASLQFKAHSASFARREQNDWVVNTRLGPSLTTMLAPLLIRKTPVVLPPQLAPSQHEIRIVLSPPPGFRIDAIPLDRTVNKSHFGSAKISFEQRPNGSMAIQQNLNFDQSFISTQDYSQWREFLTKIDRILQREVRWISSTARR